MRIRPEKWGEGLIKPTKKQEVKKPEKKKK